MDTESNTRTLTIQEKVTIIKNTEIPAEVSTLIKLKYIYVIKALLDIEAYSLYINYNVWFPFLHANEMTFKSHKLQPYLVYWLNLRDPYKESLKCKPNHKENIFKQIQIRYYLDNSSLYLRGNCTSSWGSKRHQNKIKLYLLLLIGDHLV